MKLNHRHVIGIAALIAAPLFATGANAQLLDAVKGQVGGEAAAQTGSSSGGITQGLGGALGGSGGGNSSSVLSAISGGSASSGTAGNAAGVLEFCIKNNYLSGNDASSVKDQLMGKLGGSAKASSDAGYSKGSSGVLTTSNGASLDLSSGGGLKEEITRKACDQVLDQSKSFL
ncbi:DUF2501 domain-containing protein [Bordetella muralis]|uniref:DUF2501 domain-containing protein n=1 Tax=Bordetella muralis TaxID=1649130 RepID=UPI0039F14258